MINETKMGGNRFLRRDEKEIQKIFQIHALFTDYSVYPCRKPLMDEGFVYT